MSINVTTLLLAKKNANKIFNSLINNIKHSDWNQHDPDQPDYVKNRTHYDSREEREVRIAFDGNLDGMEYVSIPMGSGLYYVKVSELAPTAEELVGGKVVLRIGDEISHDEIREVEAPEPGVRMYAYNGGPLAAMFLDDTFTQAGITLTAGTWFLFVDQNGTLAHIAELSYTVTSGELKKLDAKYLPEAEAPLAIEIVGENATIVSGSWEVARQKIESNQIPNIVIFENVQEGDNILKKQYPITLVTGMLDTQYNEYFINICFDYFRYMNSEAEARILQLVDGVFWEVDDE